MIVLLFLRIYVEMKKMLKDCYEPRFDIDLSKGKITESWLKACFTGEETIEVKTDFYKSENVVFEIYSRGKPSGIATTEATYWFQSINKSKCGFWIKTSKLKKLLREYIKDYPLSFVWGGDNKTSFMIILPLTTFLFLAFSNEN